MYPKRNDVYCPPQALDYERNILGSAISIKGVIDLVVGNTNVDDYYMRDNQVVFSTLKRMYEKRAPIDVVTVSHAIEESGYTDLVLYVTEIAECINTVELVEYYIEEVKKKSTERRLEWFGNDIKNVREKSKDHEDFLENIDKEFQKARYTGIRDKSHSSYEMVSNTIDYLMLKKTGEKIGYKSGINPLDEIIGEFLIGEMTILAGRPSQGKTALTTTIILNQIEQGVRVGFLSLEMSEQQIGCRLCAIHSGINLFKLIHGYTNDDEMKSAMESFSTISELPIFIDDTPRITASKAKAALRLMIIENGIQIAYIDHLNKMDYGGINPVIGYGIITTVLSAAAKELGIHIVLLSQLARNKDKGGKIREPVLDDLRWSGDIEADADNVIFVHRPEVYTKKEEDSGIAKLIVAKQRNGPIGDIPIGFEKRTTKFYETNGF